jgi:hypothetical protein
MEIASSREGDLTLSEASARGARGACRGYHSEPCPKEQLTQHSRRRRLRLPVCPWRTSPLAESTPWRMASGARDRVYPSRGPLRRYPSR